MPVAIRKALKSDLETILTLYAALEIDGSPSLGSSSIGPSTQAGTVRRGATRYRHGKTAAGRPPTRAGTIPQSC